LIQYTIIRDTIQDNNQLQEWDGHTNELGSYFTGILLMQQHTGEQRQYRKHFS